MTFKLAWVRSDGSDVYSTYVIRVISDKVYFMTAVNDCHGLPKLPDFHIHLASAKNVAANYLLRHTKSAGQAPEFNKGEFLLKVCLN